LGSLGLNVGSYHQQTFDSLEIEQNVGRETARSRHGDDNRRRKAANTLEPICGGDDLRQQLRVFAKATVTLKYPDSA
jgi:hypothetical protein